MKGVGAEARESQRLMVAQIRDWLDQGAPALVEAPTGTGKSYALLAAALDWLAADDRNKVVISTFTKQLQSQLAADIEALTQSAMPELAKTADMVKGSANRLSLRSLVLALVELTEADERKHRRGRQDFTDDPHYRDLVIYLVLRFLAEGRPTEEWEARSVDRGHARRSLQQLPRRLSLTSPAPSPRRAATIVSAQVRPHTVRETLNARRLIVANDALLLAHLGDFEEIGKHTLLFVDEAHELENAATSALSPELDSGVLTELAVQVAEWAQDQTGLAGTGSLPTRSPTSTDTSRTSG